MPPMDTTIRNLDEEAYRRIKSRAALEGRTLGEAVSEAIRRYVAEGSPGDQAGARPVSEADEVAEAAERAGGYGDAAALEVSDGEAAHPPPGPPPPSAAPRLAGLVERLADLGRADPEYLDELEVIQAEQPRLGAGAWES